MKKVILLLTMALLCNQAFGFEPKDFQIRVTINKPPTVESLSPTDGYVITQGSTLHIEVNATDQNIEDIPNLLYKFIITDSDNVQRRLRDWDSLPSYTYTLNENDLGINKITAQVTDGIETDNEGPVEIYIFRGSPTIPE